MRLGGRGSGEGNGGRVARDDVLGRSLPLCCPRSVGRGSRPGRARGAEKEDTASRLAAAEPSCDTPERGLVRRALGLGRRLQRPDVDGRRRAPVRCSCETGAACARRPFVLSPSLILSLTSSFWTPSPAGSRGNGRRAARPLTRSVGLSIVCKGRSAGSSLVGALTSSHTFALSRAKRGPMRAAGPRICATDLDDVNSEPGPGFCFFMARRLPGDLDI